MKERKKVGGGRGREKEKKREGKESLFTKIYYLVWDTYTLQVRTERQEETMTSDTKALPSHISTTGITQPNLKFYRTGME